MSEPTSDTPQTPGRLDKRHIVVALSGGIACYKTATVVSRLVQQGATVRVLMTEAATRFVTPLTFQSLSGQSVLTSIWQADDRPDSQHVGIARWAELMVIAPATANTIGRIANGLCDDVVSLAATALPSQTPLLLAPAMNSDMWESPAVQRNVTRLAEQPNVTLVGPEQGWQACRTVGQGRMSEPDAIVTALTNLLRG